MSTAERELVQELRLLDDEQQRMRVREWLRQRAGEVAPLLAADWSGDPALQDVGLDSMSAMELRHRIETGLAIALPADRFSGLLTFGQLAALVLERLVTASLRNMATDGDHEEVRI